MDNPIYTETQLNNALKRATSRNVYVIEDGDFEQPTFTVYADDDETDLRVEDLGAAHELYAVDGSTHREITRARHYDDVAVAIVEYLEGEKN